MILVGALAVTSFTGCSDDNIEPSSRTSWPKDSLSVFSEAEWLPGGEKGTTSNEQGCYSNPVPQIEDNQQLYTTFKTGELFFEHDANTLVKPFWGLGPAYVRSGCEYCHPSYGHGKRQDKYRANTMGNGYLLVIYHPTAGTDGRRAQAP